MTTTMTIGQAAARLRELAAARPSAREALEAFARAADALAELDEQLPAGGPRAGRIIARDLGADGPAIVLGLEPPGSPLEAEDELLAEYLIDPDPEAGTYFRRLEGQLELVPVTRDQAAGFIAEHHRRHPRRPAGWRFGVGVERGGELVGVAWAGNPTARRLADGRTLEVQRVAIRISRNAGSRLLGAIARAARALGYRRLITYTGLDENAASVKAAGFAEDGRTRGGEADRPSRRRRPVEDPDPKVRWRLDL